MHLLEIPNPEDRIKAFKYTVIAPNFSVVSTTTGKISIVIFLLRLLGPASTSFQRWFLYALTFVSICMNILAIVVIMGFCIPAEKIWRPETPGSCMSPTLQLVAGMAQASMFIFCYSPYCSVSDNFRQLLTPLPTLSWPYFLFLYFGGYIWS